MSTDYSSQKVAELQDLLKARGLPHTGKKADLIARLEASDSENPGEASTTGGATTTTTIKADVAVAEKPSSSVDTSAAPKTSKPASTQAQNKDATTKDDGEDTAIAATEKPDGVPEGEDNAPALPTVSLEQEMEKRRKRAERFGTGNAASSSTDGAAAGEAASTNAKDAEAEKLLDRQKRFGGVGGADANVAGLDALNQALPERQKKRGRQAGVESERDGKRRDSRRREGRGKAGEDVKADGKGETASTVKKTNSEQKEKDRLAAEKRKARFATNNASAAAS